MSNLEPDVLPSIPVSFTITGTLMVNKEYPLEDALSDLRNVKDMLIRMEAMPEFKVSQPNVPLLNI